MSTECFFGEVMEVAVMGKDRPRCELPEVVQTWIPGNPVRPAKWWCWTHRRWLVKGEHCSPHEAEGGRE